MEPSPNADAKQTSRRRAFCSHDLDLRPDERTEWLKNEGTHKTVAHMSYKRSRATFEADLHAPYAVFGTPLPDENDVRDDGSYLPLWKQDVRDEKGRRRLHGAFTGGWSAG